MVTEYVLSAIKKIGKPPEELAEEVLRSHITLAYSLRKVLIEEFGSQGAKLVSKIWGFKTESDVKKFIRDRGIKEVDIPTLGLLAKAWWENSFLIPYEIVVNTKERHVAHITECPYWEKIKEVFGEEQAKKVYTREHMIDTEIEELKGIARAAGVLDKVIVKVNKIMCGGDDICEFVYEPKEPSPG